MEEIERAFHELKSGRCVLIYDDDARERETDIVYASQFVTWKAIRHMRKDGGGLICTTVPQKARQMMGLPYFTDIFQKMSREYPVLSYLFPHDIPYDAKSSFGITINHRKTFTGITDRDRSLTIRRFSDFVRLALEGEKNIRKRFGDEFRSPGHVFLLNADKNLLDSRHGHTELATALIYMADLVPTATICEMMGDDGVSLSKNDAILYAKRKNYVFLEGKEIINFWKEYRKVKSNIREVKIAMEG